MMKPSRIAEIFLSILIRVESKIVVDKSDYICMYAAMRKTLILDDQLFRRAKREAGDKGATLSELVNTALRSYFFTNKPQERILSNFTMPVFGEPVHFHLTSEQLADLRDEWR